MFNVLLSVKKCPAVDIDNSNRLPFKTEYDYNTAVTYTCYQGFSHTGGDLTRTCQANKSWNGTAPTCASEFHFILTKKHIPSKKKFCTGRCLGQFCLDQEWVH